MLASPARGLLAVMEEARDPEVSVQQLARLVEQDGGLAAAVVRYANASWMGLDREVDDAARATMLLGAKAIGHLAALHAMVSAAQLVPLPDGDRAAFFEDAVRRGVAATLLGAGRAQVPRTFGFLVGFALEYGRVDLMARAPERRHHVGRLRSLTGMERIEAERDAFGTTHFEAFGHIASAWGLPEELAAPVLHHHDAGLSADPMVLVGRFADLVAEVFTAGDIDLALASCRTTIEAAGMEREGLSRLLEEVGAQTQSAADMLGVEIPEQVPFQEMLRNRRVRRNPEAMDRDELLAYVEELVEARAALEAEVDALRGEVKHLSRYDQLTGLPNRQQFLRVLRQEVGRARRHGRPLSLVVADIDRFTDINGCYGQSIGDQVLQRVGKTLRRVVRDEDFLGRIGPDEFAVILPETRQAGGRVLAERLRAALEALKVDLDDRRVVLSATVAGISLDSVPPQAEHEAFYVAALRYLAHMRTHGGNRATWAA